MKLSHQITLGTVTLISAFALVTTVTPHHSSAKSVAPETHQVAVSDNLNSDIDLTTLSAPTTPIVNGQVNPAFINRFNNAISLSNQGQFVINSKLFPINATKQEIAEVNALVSQMNAVLKQTIAKVPKANMVKVGNSVVIGQTPQVAQEIAQQSQMETTSLFHSGSNYIHHYWWGYRIGLSENTLHHIGAVTQDAGGVAGGYAAIGALGGVTLPASALVGAIGGATIILGTGIKYAPGGIVFNWTPAYPLTVWGVGWQ